MTTPTILALTGIKAARVHSRGFKIDTLAKTTGITEERLTALETVDKHKREEPWLHETKAICAALNITLFAALGLDVDRITDIPDSYEPVDALDVWFTGVPLPLRYAVRIAIALGLDDPFDLIDIPDHNRRIWATLTAGERLGAPGICPYCSAAIVGAEGHFPSCVPGVLYHPRDRHIVTIGISPKPFRAHKRRRSSTRALGLRELRGKLGLTQAEFAEAIGYHPASYYRVEKLVDPLPLDKAERIAVLYKVTVEELYQPAAGRLSEVR